MGFAWSYSRLKNFRTCPKRHYHVDIKKDYKEEESEHLIWGHEVHEKLAHAIDKGNPLPPTMEGYKDWVDRVGKLKALGYTIKVENKLAMSEDFKPTSFFDGKTWMRGVVDVLAVDAFKKLAITFDWKTGKVVDDIEQLALSAQLVFANYPTVERVGATYIWLADDTETVEYYDRDGMLPTWNAVLPTVKVMTQAAKDLNYPPKPSGLCKRYCPVSSCPHFGKGSY